MKKKLMQAGALSLGVLFSASAVQAKDLNGLWFGVVEVKQVNEVFNGAASNTVVKDVKYPYNLQLLLHSDASGNTHLLREVFIMQTKDTTNKTRVLVTNESQVSKYEGIIRRGDNKLAAIRLTSPSFDFGSDVNSQRLAVTGRVSTVADSKISGELNLAADHPLNPMKHLYHNQHREGVALGRKFDITIKPSTASNTVKSDDDSAVLSGTYEEEITGLHKTPLMVKGDIRLTRVSTIATLVPTEAGQ